MNEIIFYIYNSYPDRIYVKDYRIVIVHEGISDRQEIRIKTKQNLIKGDYVQYKNYSLKIIDRMYYPEGDKFTFVCEDIYTGKMKD